MHNSAQERALATCDLTSAIFSWLDIPLYEVVSEERKANRKTLCSLALTTRLFTQPALEALWKNMDSMGPILQLFPFIRAQSQNSITKLSLNPLHGYNSTTDWITFDRYAPWVRGIWIHSDSNQRYEINQEVYIYTTLKPHPAFLPNIRDLTISHLPTSGSEPSAQLPLLLLSPSLVSLEIQAPVLQSINNNSAFLALLAIKAPHLTLLSLTKCTTTNNPISANPQPPFSQTIRRLAVYVDSLDITQAFLHNTGTQRSLVDLVLLSCTQVVTLPTFIPEQSHTNWKLFPGEQGIDLFRELIAIEFGGSLDHIHNILGYISSPRLSSIRLTIFLATNESDFSSLLGTRLTSRGHFIDFISDLTDRWKSTLHELEITFKSNGALSSHSIVQAPEVGDMLFKPFINNKSLRHLCFINFPGKLQGVADYTHLRALLPSLESLHLPPQEIGLGIAEFRDFISSAPALKNLAISLDFTIPPSKTHKPINHALTSLNVLANRPEDFMDVVRELDDIFPNLSKLSGTGDKGWDSVYQLLQLCQFARRRIG